MKSAHLCITLLGPLLLTPALLACSSDEDPAPPASGGGLGGADGAAGAPSTACSTAGVGTLTVALRGLPAGVEGKVTLSGLGGEREVSDGDVLRDLAAGAYTVSPAPAVGPGQRVRSSYLPSPAAPESVCVGDDELLDIEYALVPSSQKLWVLNDTAVARAVGLDDAQLAESETLDAAVNLEAKAGIDLAFDRDGNLWTFGPTVSDPGLLRYPADDLGRTGQPAADRSLNVEGVACIPAFRHMAFDPEGALWLSTCGGNVLRLTPDQLEQGADQTDLVQPDVVLSNITENRDLAFDHSGALWVAADGKVLRFGKARLSADSEAPADASFTVRDAADSVNLSPDFLTFDADGNLWITDFGGNVIAKLPAESLDDPDGTALVAEASITLPVSALVNRPAFDDQGGLWVSYSAGKVARVAPAALLISTHAGSPTTPDVVLDGANIGNTASVAFFPAPAGLPLFSSHP